MIHKDIKQEYLIAVENGEYWGQVGLDTSKIYGWTKDISMAKKIEYPCPFFENKDCTWLESPRYIEFGGEGVERLKNAKWKRLTTVFMYFIEE